MNGINGSSWSSHKVRGMFHRISNHLTNLFGSNLIAVFSGGKRSFSIFSSARFFLPKLIISFFYTCNRIFTKILFFTFASNICEHTNTREKRPVCSGPSFCLFINKLVQTPDFCKCDEIISDHWMGFIRMLKVSAAFHSWKRCGTFNTGWECALGWDVKSSQIKMI